MNVVPGASSRSLNQLTPTRDVVADRAVATPSPSISSTHVSTGIVDGDTVEISGRSTMIDRLFRGVPEPAIYTPARGRSGSVYNYLTADDRSTIASMYDYARQNGIDPTQVDKVAFDLGSYRTLAPSSRSDAFVVGYDVDGNPRTGAWDSGDEEATAQRILTSKAINDSSLPQDFMRHLLGGSGRVSDVGFLEKVVYATSRSGSGGATDPAAVLAPRPRERFAAAMAAGEILTPEQARKLFTYRPTGTGGREGSFDDYADRVKFSISLLTADDKKSLGALYASTAEKYGSDSQQMKSVDRLVRTLATLRASGISTDRDAMDESAVLKLLRSPRPDESKVGGHNDQMSRVMLDIKA
jgi:hypothetical protein